MKYSLLCLNSNVHIIYRLAHTMVLTYLVHRTPIQSTVTQLTTPSLLRCVTNQLTQIMVLLSCRFTTGHFQFHFCISSGISGPLGSHLLCAVSKIFTNLV
jgi:hypothetical protein